MSKQEQSGKEIKTHPCTNIRYKNRIDSIISIERKKKHEEILVITYMNDDKNSIMTLKRIITIKKKIS